MSKIKCNHNPCNENNTLKKMTTRRMVQPSRIFYRCVVCNKVFPLTELDFDKTEKKSKLLTFLKKHLFFKEGGK